MGLRLSVRVFGLVGTTLLFAAALLAYHLSHVRHVTLAYTTALTNTIAQTEKARDMQTALLKQIDARKEIARLRGRNRQDFVKYSEIFSRDGDAVSDLSNELFGSVSDTKLRTKIERFRIAHLEFAKSLPRQPVVRPRVRGRKTHIAVRIPENPGKSLVILATQIASDLGNRAKDLALQQREALARQETIILVSTVPMAFVVLVATLLVAWSASYKAREISNVISRFADGDLTQGFGDHAASALGPLGRLFHEIINSFGKNLRDISVGTSRLECAADGITVCVAKQSAGAKSQKGQASKAARALQGISSNIVQLSADSARAAESVRKMSEVARQGKKAIDQELIGVRAIAASADETVRKMEHLGGGPDRMVRITKAVEEIANQGNLLAVNAEVDAARSDIRQSGAKSFAEETRKLEARASKAAKEIADVAGSIREEAKGAVAAATNETKQLHEGLAAITRAGASLQEIFESAEQVFDGVMRIPTLIAAQSSATEEMKSCLEEMERIAAETIEGAAESTFACQEISQAVADVQAIVSRFKLTENAGVSTVRIGRASGKPHSQVQPAKSETAVPVESVADETQTGRDVEEVLARRSVAASIA